MEPTGLGTQVFSETFLRRGLQPLTQVGSCSGRKTRRPLRQAEQLPAGSLLNSNSSFGKRCSQDASIGRYGLYGLVRDLFKDQRVLREASPEWLGRMRLDIYLPELSLAIEHQGVQHYRPIAAFGGDEGHARTVARDELKRQLCRANGVEVVDVRFDAPLTIPALRNRLQRYIQE